MRPVILYMLTRGPGRPGGQANRKGTRMEQKIPNERYEPMKSVTKGALGAAGAGAGGLVTTLVLAAYAASQGSLEPDMAQGAVIAAMTLGTSAVTGFLAWLKNRNKHRKRTIFVPDGASRKRAGRRLPGLVFFLAAALALGGCVTTRTIEHPDGSVEVIEETIDRELLAQTYAWYLAERQRLEEEGIREDAREEARRQQRMMELQLALQALARELDRNGLSPLVTVEVTPESQ